MTDDFVERATTFDGSEAPSGDRLDESESFTNYYNRLSVANSLEWNGKWRDESRQTSKNTAAVIDAIAGQLQLTDFQQNRAHRVFGELPPSYNKSKSTGLLALCVCGLVGQGDGRDYHPNQHHPSSSVENEFTRVAEDIDASYSELKRWWFRLKMEVF